MELREQVFEDLADIGAFIARTHLFNAARYVGRVHDAMERLERPPGAHPLAPSLAGYGARRMRVGSHFVLFLIDEQALRVDVLRVVHTKEDAASYSRKIR